MFAEKIVIFLRFVGKLVLLIFTIFLIFGYSIALLEKIQRANFKNLPASEFIVFGIVIIGLIYLNLLVFGIFKKQKSSEFSSSETDNFNSTEREFEIVNYDILSTGADGGHKYISTEILEKGKPRRLIILFENKLDENQLEHRKILKISGDLFDEGIQQDLILNNARII